MATEYVIAAFPADKAPRLWDFYPSETAAYTMLPSVQAKDYEGLEWRVGTYADFAELDRSFWRNRPTKEINADRYCEMLECLPPMAWEHHGTWQRFLLSEFTSGNFTEQFLECVDQTGRKRYFVKTVDARDRSTWLTPQSVGC